MPEYDCHDEGSAASFPSSDPPASSVPGQSETTRASTHSPGSKNRVAERWRTGTGDRLAGARRPGHARGRHRDDAGPRPRGDRGDHELHQHVESVGDGRRGHPRAQRRRARPALKAVGQDLARPRIQGGHGVPRPGRADRAAGAAGLQPRRLRLHDLHREQRPARRGDLPGRQRPRPGGGLGALGQPQLRGSDPRRREDELPRVAAAVRGLRARRHHGCRHRQRSARRGPRRPARSICATSGPPSTRSPRRSSRRSVRTCSARATPRCSTATSAGTRSAVPAGDRFAWDPASTYVRLPPYFDAMPPEPSRSPTSPVRARWSCSAIRSRPTTSRPPGRSAATGPPGPTCRTTT